MSEQATYDIEKIKLENAALRKYAAIQAANEDRIGCPKIYIDITGDIEASLVLDELIFWTLPRKGAVSGLRIWKDGQLWLAVTRGEWWERKRLTPRQADRAIEKLIELGLIEKKIFRFNTQATTHIRLIASRFFALYGEQIEKQNPPEAQEETLAKDLDDLYAMMTPPESPNGDTPSPNGDTPSPNGDTPSPNGDSINSINTVSTQSLAPGQKKQVRYRDPYWDLLHGRSLDPKQLEQYRRVSEIRERTEKVLSRNLDWDGLKSEWRNFDHWLIDIEDTSRQTIEQFMAWFRADAFRAKGVIYLTPGKIKDWWLQAFVPSLEASGWREL